MSDAPITRPLQEGASPPATPDDLFPKDIQVNGRVLSIEGHYRIARMCVGEIRRRYAVKDPAEFQARVKAAIRFWDGVDL